MMKRLKGSLRPIRFHQIRPFFANHNASRIRVARHNFGHHGAVNHPQTRNAVNPQTIVNNAHFVASHAASADGMIDTFEVLPDVREDFFVRFSVFGIEYFFGKWLKSLGKEDFSGNFVAFYQ